MYSVNKVSVIIPNHGRDISGVLKSIKNSTYKNVEIVVVDEGFERSKQRNIGIDRATGDYFLFLDSDTEVSPKLIEDCLSKKCSVYIPEKIMTKGLFGKLRNWERQFYTATAVDVVRFIPKNVCPYFDETLHGPEDSDFDRRVFGKRATSSHYLYHYDNIGFWQYCKKKAYYAKSMKKFEKRNPGDKVLNFKWRCWTVFVENNKWKRLIKYPHYTTILVFLLFVRGVIYLWKKH